MSLTLNAFDQYSQAENRLTHALGVTLERSKEFRAVFLKELAGNPRINRDAQVTLQMAQGTVEVNGEKCGIPDLAIIDDYDNAIIVEAKLGASLAWQQLASHEHRADRNGVSVAAALAITGRDKDGATLLQWQKDKRFRHPWRHVTWQEVYRLACHNVGINPWVKELRDYMQIMATSLDEVEMGADVKIIEFTGVTKEMQENYTPALAKRLLRSLMDELRADKAFLKDIGIPTGQSRARKAIKTGMRVWDLLSPVAGDENFTHGHHFTVGIAPERLEAMLTIPDKAIRKLIKFAQSVTAEEFAAIMNSFTDTLAKADIIEAGGKPVINIVQRRYKGMNLHAVDGHAEFDPRLWAGTTGDKKDPAIRPQPEWLSFCQQLISNKDSNIQFQIGLRFPYDSCPATHGRAAIDLVKNTFRAVMPLVKKLGY